MPEFQAVDAGNRAESWPRAETPTHYMTMGFDENLDVTIRTTLRKMIDLLVERHKLSREDAYLLASDAADFSITQLVDGKRVACMQCSGRAFSWATRLAHDAPVPAWRPAVGCCLLNRGGV